MHLDLLIYFNHLFSLILFQIIYIFKNVFKDSIYTQM